MKKRNGMLLALSAVSLLSLALSSCGDEGNPSSSSNGNDDEIYTVYKAYQENGGTLSYDDWLASIKGEKGDKGDKGDDGKDGSSVLTGKGEPSSTLGKDGDSYIDTLSFDYYTKANGAWTKQGNISGKSDESSGEHTVNFHLDGELVKTLSVKDGSKMSVPSSEELPKGYIIEYWYVLEGTFKSPWSFSGGTVTSDLDLYAKFEYETYTVSLVTSDGSDTYETSVSYKQAYDFSNYSRYSYADHLENEEGVSFAVSGTWTLTHGETLTPVFSERTITYEFYEVTSYSGGEYWLSNCEKTDDVSNPNPVSASGKPSDITAPLKDVSKEGYRFEGWFKLSGSWFEPLDNLNDAYFAGKVYGLFSKYHSLSVISNNENAGAIEFVGGADGRACTGDEITVKATTNEGYEFVYWHDGADIVSQDPSYSFNMPDEDYSLTAVWNVFTYEIRYKLDGGTNSENNPSQYTADDDILLESPTKTGYEFKGWYSDSSYSTEVTSIPQGSTGYKTLYAKWEAVLYSLNASSTDETKGSVSVSGEGYTDEMITVTATPADGYALKGWYRDGKLVSWANDYTFKMPAGDYSLTAEFCTEAEAVEESNRRKALGIEPVIDSENDVLTFGLYPQTHVSDSTTIASLNALESVESNGWYFLNGEYYVKKEANPWDSDYVFDDGTTIDDGTEYWFKCEPITWKILSSNDGEYSLVSTLLLDAHEYDDSSNNYANSEIREWLNNDFYKSAFSLGNSLIQTTTVDNSASTTSSSSNRYACSSTEDNVYLLSYKDYKNINYFSDVEDTDRQCKTTDWARANGAWYSTSSSYLYNGYYWTRSPYSSNSGYAWGVDGDGGLNYFGDVDYSYASVRPSLRIKVA